MATDIDIDPYLIEQLKQDRPCETRLHDCDERAIWLIWVKHHSQGCGTYGYRCGWHFNLLILEAQRMLSRIRREPEEAFCADCDAILTSVTLSDYVRGIRL